MTDPPIGTFPVTGELIDEALQLESLIQDLAFAKRALSELGGRPVLPLANQPIQDVDTTAVALWNSAAIAYGRCFNQGTRSQVSKALVPTEAELLDAHRTLVDMRRQHIAHLARDSDHEQLTAYVEAKAVTGEGLAIRFTTLGKKTLLPSPAELAVCRRLISTAETRARELQADVLERVTTRLRAIGGDELQRAATTGRTVRLD